MTIVRTSLIATALAAVFATLSASAQQPAATKPDAARPADATAIKPSDSGAQSTLPSSQCAAAVRVILNEVAGLQAEGLSTKA